MRTFARSLLPFLLAAFSASQALAAPLIRDAEIEHTLRQFGEPIFSAAGLKPSSIRLFIVNDDSLNAFVAGGANMFVHTWLIQATTSPDMLLGVMAHETGHISGGHLAKGSEKLKDAQMGSIFSYVLGAAAAVAAGSPEAAIAVVGGGQSMVGRNLMAFTRTHENAADQAALSFMDKLGISSSGMVKMFELLQRNERQRIGNRNIDPYVLTHPLSAQRLSAVRAHLEKSNIPKGQYPKSLDMPYQRMVAKLYSFLQSPERTLQKYPLGNKTLPARMARAIAYYKMPDMPRATAEMDSLLAENPKDPFLHELKGQILFENARPKEALASYQTAAKLLPSNPLILVELAKVELSQKDAPLIASATAHLEKATMLDGTNATAWRWLATAYGKAGNIGMSALALAEEALLRGDTRTAMQQADHAITQKKGTPSAQRAQDLKLRAIEMKRQQDER
jgi:predicted Zn-dependent protease